MRAKKLFTLVEMTMAMAIFMVLVVGVTMAFTGIYRSWQRMARINKRLKANLIVDRVVDSAFRNTVPFTWKDENRKERFVFKGDPDSVVVSYLHRINDASQGGVSFLKLHLEENKLVAEHSKNPILWWNDDNRGTIKEALAENVARISFLYADEKNGEIAWINDWDDEKSVNIPLAIQMNIEWMDGSHEVWLRRISGVGRRETYGIRRNTM